VHRQINRAIKHYKSLFTLPSHRTLLLLFFASCIGSGILITTPLKPSYRGLLYGLTFGASFFVLTSITDLLSAKVLMRNDLTFNFRRSSALSFFSSLLFFFFCIIGSLISAATWIPNLWRNIFLLGFFVTLNFRLLIAFLLSYTNKLTLTAFAVASPIIGVLPVIYVHDIIGLEIESTFTFFILLDLIVAIVCVEIFLYLLNRVGKTTVGVSSESLFKAFFVNWTANINFYVEQILEDLGKSTNVKISFLVFRGEKGLKAAIIVPAIHPGPFKNVGSSALASDIQSKLEEKWEAVSLVPHGLSGHELDLTSTIQKEKVLGNLPNREDFKHFYSVATPFVRVENDEAKASCQIFGDCALITLTTAPKTMEDIPQFLDSEINKEAKRSGLSCAIPIDAHNSIQGPFIPENTVKALRKVASIALKEALKKKRSPFEIGAAKIIPEDFTLEDGAGPGGINVLVNKVEGKTAAYIVIDGNNMISGLREEILRALNKMGIDDGEVLTTDTHLVNGIVLTERGWHPIGEVMDKSKLISYIIEAVSSATKNMEPAEASWLVKRVEGVKVIGETQIENIAEASDKIAKRAARLVTVIFPTAAVFLTALSFLL